MMHGASGWDEACGTLGGLTEAKAIAHDPSRSLGCRV
jgi:hypothetical protein